MTIHADEGILLIKRPLLSFSVLLLLMQTGCWDLKSIQHTNYITAIGWDYKQGRYAVYVQMLDFSNVAKQEGGKSADKPSVWIGHAEGKTVFEALTNLYYTSQQMVFWGHLSATVFTEDALKHGILSYLDGITRFREFRYFNWVFGTREPIDKLLAAIPFFHQSPLASILHEPVDSYKQQSVIRPLLLSRLVTDLREPGYTALLPSLTINKEVWSKNERQDPKLETDGVFSLRNGIYAAWTARKDLGGVSYLENAERKSIVVSRNGAPSAAVRLMNIRASVTPRIAGSEADFTILVNCRAKVTELLEKTDEAELKRMIETKIRTEIERTFASGKDSSVDIYRLEHVLYRDKFVDWSRLTRKGSRPLGDYALDPVQVSVDLTNAGMAKFTERRREY